MEDFTLKINFSGLIFSFIFPSEINIPEEFLPLLYYGEETADEEFVISLQENLPFPEESSPVFSNGEMTVFERTDGQLRIYGADKESCFCVCLIGKNGKHKLYFRHDRWSFYASPFRPLHLIAGEVLLLKYNAFLLHSSVVALDGYAVLFCGESGAGKSTQAELWEKHLGAKIINGDRCVVMLKDGKFFGGGSPWCGTSGIRTKEILPVKGIIFPEKANENTVICSHRDSFFRLFPNVTVNMWDKNFTEKISVLLESLCDAVPIYRLRCRIDENAVLTAYNALFGKENQHEK